MANSQTVDLKSFLSAEHVDNRLGEGDYHVIRSQAINVLLVGRSQTGKSTIANNLINPYLISRTDGYAKTSEPACISTSLSTSHNETYYNVNIIDTPDLQEKRLSVEEEKKDSELLELTARCIEENITFINAVCFVSIIGKTHEHDVEVFEYVQKFLGNKYSSNSILLLTHCDQTGNETDLIDIVQNMTHHARTQKILDYCKLGVKYFGTMDFAELTKWQHNSNTQEELVVATLKRVEVWRNDLLKTFTECAPITIKDLAAINKDYQEKLRKQLKEMMKEKKRQQCPLML